MNERMKHTPGPWLFRERRVNAGDMTAPRWSVLAGGDESILICSLKRYDEEDAANARLIAAAPELLEAAEALLEKIGHVCGVETERRALLRALAKATGGTQ